MLRDKSKWKAVRDLPEYEVLRTKLSRKYNEICLGKDIPVITFSDEIEFCKTGNRSIFEDKYFARREQLGVYAAMSMIYPENAEYLEMAENLICEICNEYSWQVPAHRRADWPNKRDGIDLFAAETGMYLAEIKYMLIERLSPLVIERITNELRWRILDSFENEKCWFEELRSNWASVCGCGVGVTFMYEAPDRFCRIKKRIDRCMSNYLDGICDEGSTSEGISYWRYGFSFFVLYHEILRKHSLGRIDKFKDEKVRRLAGFFSSVMLDDDVFVSFSDSSTAADIPAWLMYFINREYGIGVLPIEKCRTKDREISCILRDFMYYTPGVKEIIDDKNQEIYYKELQWYIKKTESYSFAAKGGNNAEEHNHNDIGSFIVVNNGRQVLCDLGAANYCAKYFGRERYTFLNTSSLGHSVPVVGGKEQGTGKEFFGELSVCDGVVGVDMKRAYPEDINKLQRSFILKADEIILTDSFDKQTEVTERFVTEIEPVIEDNKVILDKTLMIYPKEWDVSCKCEYTTRDSDTKDRRVYLLDFTKAEETDNFTLYISFYD